MANKQDLERIKRKVNKDKKLTKLNERFDSHPSYNLPVRELYEEIENLHMTRKTRQLKRNSDSFTQDLMDGMLQDQSVRSRLTEIIMTCLSVTKSLRETLDNLSGYISVEYADELSILRTKAERTNFVDKHILATYYKYVRRVEKLRESAELVIVDIDKAGFNYKGLIEAAKMVSGGREVV